MTPAAGTTRRGAAIFAAGRYLSMIVAASRPASEAGVILFAR